MSLRARLTELAARIARADGAAALSAALVTALGIAALGALALGGGRWLVWWRVVPFVVWGGVLVGAGAVWYARRRRHRFPATPHEVAAVVEQEHGLRRGALVGLVQLHAERGPLIARDVARIEARLGAGPWAPALTVAARRVQQQSVVAAVAAVLVVVVTGVGRPDGWRALLSPVAAWTGALLAPLSLERTPAVVVRGRALDVTVEAPGRRAVAVAWRATGAAWRDTTLRVVDGTARLHLAVVDAPLHVVASDGRTRSDTLAVLLRERPYAGDVRLRASFPSYLRRPPEELSVDAVLRVPEGTSIEWGTRVAGLTALALVGGADTLSARLADGRATGRLTVRSSTTWGWSASPVEADLPPALWIEMVPDPAPEVRIVDPFTDVTVEHGQVVPFSVVAIDDLAVRTVSLRMWRVREDGSRTAESRRVLAGAESSVRSVTTEVDLGALGAVDGETVVVVAEAQDAAPFGRVGTSAERRLRLPTRRERRDAAVAAADSAVRAAMAAATAQRALEQRTGDAARARPASAPVPSADGRPAPVSFASQERVRALAEDQRALSERVEALSDRASDLARELTAAGLADSSVQRQLRDAQRLLDEALTPELQARLQQLAAQRQAGGSDEVQDALRQLQREQTQARDALERSTELLKRAALEGSMQALSADAREVADAQRQFADSASAGARPESARELATRAEQVQQQARDLAERLRREGSPEARAELERAAAEAAESRRSMDAAVAATERQARAEAARESAARDSVARDSAGGAVPPTGPRQQTGQSQQAQGEQQSQQSQQSQQAQRGQQSQQAQGAQQSQREQRGAAGPPRGDDRLPGDLAAPNAPPSPGPGSDPGAASRDAANRAADAMDRAASSVASARAEQISAWKQDLTEVLDQSIQQTQQMAQQQDALRDQAQQGDMGGEVRGQQNALQRELQQTADRVAQQARQSALVSPRTQQAMAEAQERVAQAGEQMRGGASSADVAQSMSDAADALRQTANALSRDRTRAGQAQSASGMPELTQQMQDLAQQQGALNDAAAHLMADAATASSEAADRAALERLADRQRELARGLHAAGEQDDSGRSDQMARDAEQVARAFGRGELDAAVLERQQRLFRRMLDAGRALEQDERDPNGPRESRRGSATSAAPATGAVRGAAAQRYREPTYDELRALSPEARALVLDYFRRLNADKQ